MKLETRVFFKLPSTGTASAPSLTNQDVAQLFGPFFEGGMEPLPSDCPEKRTDHYLVIGGKIGGAVGVKLRNQGTGKNPANSKSKLAPLCHYKKVISKKMTSTAQQLNYPPSPPGRRLSSRSRDLWRIIWKEYESSLSRAVEETLFWVLMLPST
jgi:hypothetical protein